MVGTTQWHRAAARIPALLKEASSLPGREGMTESSERELKRRPSRRHPVGVGWVPSLPKAEFYILLAGVAMALTWWRSGWWPWLRTSTGCGATLKSRTDKLTGEHRTSCWGVCKPHGEHGCIAWPDRRGASCCSDRTCTEGRHCWVSPTHIFVWVLCQPPMGNRTKGSSAHRKQVN